MSYIGSEKTCNLRLPMWVEPQSIKDYSLKLGLLFVKVCIGHIWVVVKIMVPFWVPIIIRHLLFRVPKKGP